MPKPYVKILLFYYHTGAVVSYYVTEPIGDSVLRAFSAGYEFLKFPHGNGVASQSVGGLRSIDMNDVIYENGKSTAERGVH